MEGIYPSIMPQKDTENFAKLAKRGGMAVWSAAKTLQEFRSSDDT
jgi:hypothetical protein